jgi:aquaporin Z
MTDATPRPSPHTRSGEAAAVLHTEATASAAPMRNVGGEFIATVILMLAGPGLLVLGPTQIGTLAVAVSFGGALAIAIGVIGAVANPALSLALLIVREISPRELVEDWIGQFLGGVVGAAIVWGINDQTRSAIGGNGWDGGGFSELGSVIAAELVFSVVLVVVFLSAISNGLSTASIAGFTGLASALGMLVLLGISGGGMNPARSFGSAVFTDTDPNALGQIAVFIIVPLVAAVAAVFIWLAIDEADVDDTVFDETFVDSIGDAIDGTVD